MYYLLQETQCDWCNQTQYAAAHSRAAKASRERRKNKPNYLHSWRRKKFRHKDTEKWKKKSSFQAFLMLGAPELNTLLQVRSHESGTEKNHLSQLAYYTSFPADQEMVDFLGCKCTLPVHVELFVHQYLLSPSLHGCCLFPCHPAYIYIQDCSKPYAFGLVETHVAHLGLPLEPVKIPLDGIPFLQHADCTTLFGVIHKLPGGILNPTVHIANKNTKQYRSQCRPLKNTTLHWFLTRTWNC